MMLPRKIPFLAGLVLVLTLVGSVVAVVELSTRTRPTASASEVPQYVEFTNIADTKFTVTWKTQSPATGAITVDTPTVNARTVHDERDAAGLLGEYTTHSVTYSGATSNTEYEITILSNDQKHTASGNMPYIVQTAPTLSSNPPARDPVFGSVVTADNLPASGAIVYVTLEGGQKLSTLVQPSGSWLLPLTRVRTTSLDAFKKVEDRQTLDITVRFEDEDATAITDTKNSSPVPTIVTGKGYDFRGQQAGKNKNSDNASTKTSTNGDVAGSSTQSSSSFDSLGSPATGGTKNRTFSLLSPKNGAALSSFRPHIEGTGIPDKRVSITLGITAPVSDSTIVDDDGTWDFTPTKDLAPGKQSVTVTSLNTAGEPLALTHTFTIHKSGTQVLGNATPSATLTPTATPTDTATPSVTSTPTPTATDTEPPVSGSTLPTILIILFASALILSGFVVLI